MHYNNSMELNFINLTIRKLSCVVLILFFQVSYATEQITLKEIGIPQNAELFVQSNKHLLNHSQQKIQANQYLKKLFLPWSDPFNKNSTQLNNIKRAQEQEIQFYKKNKIWGENLRIHSSEWINDLETNADWQQFPNFLRMGITVDNTSIRSLPSEKPSFFNPDLAGEGYPFDTIQKTLIPAGFPVQILHRSRNQDFYYVRSAISSGWIPVRDIAFVNNAFIHKWKNSSFVVLIKENIPMIDAQNLFRFSGSTGLILPYDSQKKERYIIHIPIADQHRNAIMETAVIPKNAATLFPFAFNQANAAMLINRMLNQAYGWGGAMNNRDCSSTTRDFFATFGIWLPRHSTDQLSYAHEISLSNMSNKQKIKTILNKGIPFLTLLGHPGHVMLYVGEYKSQPIVFHNKWGLKYFNPNGKEERVLIGFSALTPLSLGENRNKTESLLESTDRMMVLFKN